MPIRNAAKIKLLKIWEILCQETDEEHPMESTVLMDRLAKIGIPCERKTLYHDVQTLCDFGYEVMCARGKKNQYYIAERNFDLPELHILLDAVQAARFITPKKTKQLADKIAGLAGSRKGEIVKRNIVEFSNQKIANEQIYYSVDEIVRAINKKKQIEFKYFDFDAAHNKVYRREGEEYVVNPYATVFSDENYYLLAYRTERKSMLHFRVDRMENVQILNSDIIPLDVNSDFNIAEHKKEVFGMFNGKMERVQFIVDKSLLDAMFDKFGSQIRLEKYDNEKYIFSADVQISPVFLGWCCSFGDKLKIVDPESAVETLKRHIYTLSQLYN